MPGSAVSVANANIVLNTAVAEEIAKIYAKLEGTPADALKEKVMEVLKEVLSAHKKVLFNGNGYTEEWVAEAEKRGLPNLVSTVDAIPHYTDEKNMKIFKKFNIYTEAEVAARRDILLEKYSNVRNIEAKTMIDMSKKELLPATLSYIKEVCDSVAVKKQLEIDASVEEKLARKLTGLAIDFEATVTRLIENVTYAGKIEDVIERSKYFHDPVLTTMTELRKIVDEIEVNMPKAKWPIPVYTDMIYNV
jgi:glutamine synthetase